MVLCARLFFLALFHDESVPKLQRVVEAGTCEEGPLKLFTWCTLESSRGKNGIYSCTGLLYFDSGIWFHSWQDWERAPLDIRWCHYPTWAITGCRSIWIPLNYFRSNFFPFLIIHKIRSRHQTTTHNTIQHSTTKYSSSSPSIFHSLQPQVPNNVQLVGTSNLSTISCRGQRQYS